jgi:hypothetical protein
MEQIDEVESSLDQEESISIKSSSAYPEKQSSQQPQSLE